MDMLNTVLGFVPIHVKKSGHGWSLEKMEQYILVRIVVKNLSKKEPTVVRDVTRSS